MNNTISQRYLDGYCAICNYKIDGKRELKAALYNQTLVWICNHHPSPPPGWWQGEENLRLLRND